MAVAVIRLVVIFVLLLACQVGATQKYVNRSGDDSNDGLSAGNAFRTMAKICTTAVAGDTINGAGVFDEDNDYGGATPNGVNACMFLTQSGTLANPVVWRMDPDSSVWTVMGHEGIGNRWALTFANNVKHHEFYGMLYTDHYKGVYLNGADSIKWYDCTATRSKGTASFDQNAGGWLTGWEGDVSSGIIWKRCTVSDVKRTATFNDSLSTGVADPDNNSGWHLYLCWYSLIDSCTATDVTKGVYFKVNGYHSTVRYSNFYNLNSSMWGIETGDHVTQSASYITNSTDSAGALYLHHNIIGSDDVTMDIGIQIGQTTDADERGLDTLYVYGNGIYNVDRGINFSTAGSGSYPNDTTPFWQEHYVWNNALVNCGDGTRAAMNITDPDSSYDFVINPPDELFDYNGYFHSASANRAGRWDLGSTLSLAGWQSASGLDANSSAANPNFTDVGNRDWRHTGSTDAFYVSGGGDGPVGGLAPDTIYTSVGPLDSCDVQGGDGSSCLDVTTRTRVKGVRQ